jgi:hypothetical protein
MVLYTLVFEFWSCPKKREERRSEGHKEGAVQIAGEGKGEIAGLTKIVDRYHDQLREHIFQKVSELATKKDKTIAKQILFQIEAGTEQRERRDGAEKKQRDWVKAAG